MRIDRRRLTLLLLLTGGAVGARLVVFEPSTREDPVASDVPARHDAEALGRLVTLPRRPVAVAWATRRLGGGGWVPGPEDHVLFAVATFEAADAAAIAASMEARAAPFEAEVPTWVATALGAKAQVLEAQDFDAKVFGVRVRVETGVREATPFLRAPFLGGCAIPLDDGRSVVVVLWTS